MTEETVSHRELQALLKPLNDSQDRIEKKLEILGDLETRVTVLEAGKVNWALLVAILAVVSGWILPFVRVR